MSKRDWIETAVATIAGTGIGAALMYMFDPEVGDSRRAKAASLAHDYASQAGEALGAGWEHVSDGAHHLADKARGYAGSAADMASDHAHGVANYAGKLWSRGSSHAQDAAGAASGFVSDTHDQIRGWGRNASRRASKALGREQHSALGLTAGVVGALALGAGVMFLLDPAQGRRRRAMIRDKATGFAGDTAEYAKTAGRAIASKTSDLAGSARDYAGQAVNAVKSAVGHSNGATPEQTPTTTQSA